MSVLSLVLNSWGWTAYGFIFTRCRFKNNYGDICLLINIAVSVVHGIEEGHNVKKTIICVFGTNEELPAGYTLDGKDFEKVGKWRVVMNWFVWVTWC